MTSNRVCRAAAPVPRRSVVDGSAHCTSSNQARRLRSRLSSSDAISRLRRSCDPPAVSAASRAADESFAVGGMSWAYQLGASARTRRVRLPSCSCRCRLSRASSTGRYASCPRGVRSSARGRRVLGARALRARRRRLRRAWSCRRRLRRDHDQPGLAAMRALELMVQRLELILAADDVEVPERRRGANVTADRAVAMLASCASARRYITSLAPGLSR